MFYRKILTKELAFGAMFAARIDTKDRTLVREPLTVTFPRDQSKAAFIGNVRYEKVSR